MALGLRAPPRVKVEASGASDGYGKSGLAANQFGGQIEGRDFLGETRVITSAKSERQPGPALSAWTHTHTHVQPLQPHQDPARQIQQTWHPWRMDLQAPPRAPSGATLPSLIPPQQLSTCFLLG